MVIETGKMEEREGRKVCLPHPSRPKSV